MFNSSYITEMTVHTENRDIGGQGLYDHRDATDAVSLLCVVTVLGRCT